MNTHRIIIADDHQLFRDGVRLVLEHTQRFEVVAEAGNGHEALEALKTTEADVLVLDINMPDMDGLETAGHLRKEHPQLRILIVTMLGHGSLIKRLMRLGVDGYILKENSQKEMVAALDAIVAGNNYYSAEVTQAVMKSLEPATKKTPSDNVTLTNRETEVIRMIAREMTTQEIADALFIAKSTVISHRKNILRKLDVRNIAGMVKYAMERGLLDD